jgi:hypothetical protein
MMTGGSFKKLGVVFVLLGTACGGGGPTNTVATTEDAGKIRTSADAAMGAAVGTAQTSCPGGGTVASETTLGIDLLKGEASTHTDYTFNGCVSREVTLSGSLRRTVNSNGSTTITGDLDTSLGSCIVDLQGVALATASGGELCGFALSEIQ